MATATKRKPKSTTPRGDGVTISHADLAAALNLVGRAVPTKSPKPILHNVLLESGRLVGTDLEVRVEVPIAYAGPAVLLPHGRLRAIVGATTDDVQLHPDGVGCDVTVGRGHWRLPTENPVEYPAWSIQQLRPLARMPQEVLRRMLRSVSYATDSESSRYALGGVLLEMAGGTLHAVATDGRRLSVVSEDVDQATDDASVVVPARAVAILESMLTWDEGGVQLEVTGRELVATCGDGPRLVCRLLEGRFPRWRDEIPAADAKRSAASCLELLSAVRQAAIVTNDQSRGVVFQFGAELTLSGQSAESGTSTVTCPMLEPATPARVKLDPAYVVEALRASDPDEPVEILATTANDPVVLYSGSLTAVVMPMAEDAT